MIFFRKEFEQDIRRREMSEPELIGQEIKGIATSIGVPPCLGTLLELSHKSNVQSTPKMLQRFYHTYT